MIISDVVITPEIMVDLHKADERLMLSMYEMLMARVQIYKMIAENDSVPDGVKLYAANKMTRLFNLANILVERE